MRTPLLLLLLIVVVSSPAVAQEMPASVMLGRRVIGFAHRAEVLPAVVIVEDLTSFVEAVSHWTPRQQFPVLLDDGSHRSREDIARFVRAFGPTRVVRFAFEGETPADPAERRRWIEGALARVFDSGSDPTPTLSLVALWQDLGHAPPGVVVADDQDEAWAAALALAAGRGQPIVWVKRTLVGRVNAAMVHEAAARLVEQIETGCERTGLPWRESGDVIEAVTLCLNTGVKLRADFGENQAEHFALTDVVGRHGAMQAGRLVPTERWAWAGQITGDAASCVYQAMCSLFFEPGSAWLFDGYREQEPWDAYDATRADELLRAAGFETTLIDHPRGTHADWLLSAARAIDADLVLVNSKGRPHDFDLLRGRGSFRDAPLLARPAAVHFVHSWSATRPADRKTVAGRWLERGAFAYVGSVHEPFLQAFVPTPAVAGRLLAGAPLAAAVRSDGPGAAWKIAVLGDPLLVFAKARQRSDAPLPIEADALRDGLGDATAAGRFADAAALLVMLGDDARAVELADAVLADAPESFDVNLAEAVALAAFRVANTRVLAAAVRSMGPARSEVTGAADALWLHAEPLLAAGVSGELASALGENLREGVLVRDAISLARALRAAGDADAGNAVLEAAERRVEKAEDVQRLRAERR